MNRSRKELAPLLVKLNPIFHIVEEDGGRVTYEMSNYEEEDLFPEGVYFNLSIENYKKYRLHNSESFNDLDSRSMWKVYNE
jgi:hypothetical protein